MEKTWLHHHHQSIPIETRFWEKVDRREENECWNWQGNVGVQGYGVFINHGKGYKAHRIAWELTKGKIPDGMFVCHSCDNPTCCNPFHCFLGSCADNLSDMRKKNRGAYGSTHGRARLNENQVLAIRKAYEMGIEMRQLAILCNVGETTIGHICKRETWKHI